MTNRLSLEEKVTNIISTSSIVAEKKEFEKSKFVDSLKGERKDWIVVMNALLAFAERVQSNSSNTEAKFVTHGMKITVSGKPVKIRVNGEVVAPEQLSKLIVDFTNVDEVCDNIQDLISLEREGYLDDIKQTIRDTRALQMTIANEYKAMRSQFSNTGALISLLIEKSSRRFRWFVDVRNYLHWSVYVSGLAVMMFMLYCTARYLFE